MDGTPKRKNGNSASSFDKQLSTISGGFRGAATMAPDAFRPSPQSALLEARAEPMRGADAACRLLHRRTDEGLLKTGFVLSATLSLWRDGLFRSPHDEQ